MCRDSASAGGRPGDRRGIVEALVVLGAVTLVALPCAPLRAPLARDLRRRPAPRGGRPRRATGEPRGCRTSSRGAHEKRRAAAFGAVAEAPVEIRTCAARLRNALRVPVLLCRGVALVGVPALGAALVSPGVVSVRAVGATGLVVLRVFGPLQEAL